MKRLIAFSTIVAAAFVAPAEAAITIYTSQSAYIAAIDASGVDDYDDLVPGLQYAVPLTRTAGVFGYTVAGSEGALYGAGSNGDGWLSIDENTSSITYDSFGAGVRGAGANFFGTNLNGGFLGGNGLTLTASDLGGTVTTAIVDPAVSTFIGFVSTTGLTAMTVRASTPDAGYWPTVNNLILGGSAVPEPATWAMMILGMGAIGVAMRRARKVGVRAFGVV